MSLSSRAEIDPDPATRREQKIEGGVKGAMVNIGGNDRHRKSRLTFVDQDLGPLNTLILERSIVCSID